MPFKVPRRMGRRKFLSPMAGFVIGMFSVLSAGSAACAGEITEVRDVGPFRLQFWEGTVDRPTVVDGDSVATARFDSAQRDGLALGAQYWAETLDTSGRTSRDPIVVNMVPVATPEAMASATSFINSFRDPVDGVRDTRPYQMIVKGAPASGGSDMLLEFSAWAFSSVPSGQAMRGQSYTSSAIHEFAHGLGIASYLFIYPEDGYSHAEFGPVLSRWDSHLRDYYGEAATPGMPIVANGSGSADNGVFEFHEDAAAFKNPTFRGKPGGAIESLLGAGSLDAPVLGTNQGSIDGNALSHTGQMNWLMGYGDFIVMPFFSEMELAMLEEMGYKVNRRAAFGKSYYHNAGGVEQIGVGYDQDKLYGVGAHVFTDNLRLRQTADISSRGQLGTGIRIDGSDNHVVIERGTRVAADGLNGAALLSTFGHGNVVVHRGHLSATGLGGIGARFEIGQKFNYGIGSYWTDLSDLYDDPYWKFQNREAHRALNGPLIDRFDVTGSIAGDFFALYIGDNAHVREVNFMQGAELTGLLVSDYNNVGRGTDLGTVVTFGKRPNADGSAGTGADPGFEMTLRQAILGYGAPGDAWGWGWIELDLVGGRTIVKTATPSYVRSMHVASGATLDLHEDLYLRRGVELDPEATISFAAHLDSAAGRLTSPVLWAYGESRLSGRLVPYLQSFPTFPGASVAATAPAVMGRDDDGMWGQLNLAGATLSGRRLFYDYAFAPDDADAGRLDLTVTANRLTPVDVARSTNNRAVASALASWRPDVAPEGALADQWQAFYNAPDADAANRLLREINGTRFAGSADLSRLASRRLDRQLGDWTRRAFTSAWDDTADEDGTGVATADAHASLYASDAGEWQAFGEGFGQWSRLRGHDGEPGYDLKTFGGAVALDRRVDACGVWRAGAAMAAEHAKQKWETPGDHADADAVSWALYSRMAADNWFGLAEINYGLADVDTTRRMPTQGVAASSDYTAHWYGAGWSGGYRWRAGDWDFGPSAGMRYTKLRLPEVRETGAGALNQTMARRHEDSLAASARLEVARRFCGTVAGHAVEWRPWLAAGVEVETLDNGVWARMSFAEQPGVPSFTGRGPEAGRVTFEGRAGMSATVHDRATLSLEYQGDFRQRQQTHGGQAGFSLLF